MDGNVVGMGVVGAGSIGIRAALEHLSLPDVQDRVQLAAVCDPAPGRAAAAAEKYHVPAHYVTYEELLEDPGVDAVTLCSPIGLHYEQGMMAIEAGKHVHFNKTMAITVKECDDLIEAAGKADVYLVASPGMMLHPHNRRIRKAILEGKLGKMAWAVAGTAMNVYHLQEAVRQGDDPLSNIDPTWYWKKPGGGPQYDVTVYCLHNLTGILGPAKRVTAMSGMVVPEREFRGRKIECEADDTTLMLLDFGDSLFGAVYATVSGRVNEGFQPNFYGTEAAVIGTKLNGEELRLEDDHEPHVVGKHAEMGENHVFEDMMQLVDWIREGKPSIANAEHARHVIDIIEAAYRSAETGETQELVTTFKTVPWENL
ncbi:MAG: Gfo/Idh/MocA family oxidoreductase [Chloroflexota bacterium]|nr:Gfo/Idh/MocA family oxidoreductase [Chloroflexota bacterium]